MVPRNDWIGEILKILGQPSSCPVQVIPIIRSQLITLKKELVNRSIKDEISREALIARSTDGKKYEITLYRFSLEPLSLSAQERFALAHELGHYFLDSKYKCRPHSDSEYNQIEVWCDRFARRLLIPHYVCKRLITPERSRVRSSLLLSQACKVPLYEAAMAVVAYCPDSLIANVKVDQTRNGKESIRVNWAASQIESELTSTTSAPDLGDVDEVLNKVREKVRSMTDEQGKISGSENVLPLGCDFNSALVELVLK